MTQKERVLKYFDEWDGKGINPANGCSVRRFINHYMTGNFWIALGGKDVYSLSIGTDSIVPQGCTNEEIETAARILKIDRLD